MADGDGSADGADDSGPHVRSLLGAYALEALGPEEDRWVADHLAGCDRCGAAYREVADTRSLLALLDEDDLR
ncbi:zf-HC2 domain-containing protein [Streptomyces corynorhini]|uniref:Zf-HC2 domain-containing protein n=1 Tax=Streptomyces corynorhini TaxID=2282652 RepID=A0A370B706_9ACTN|nr:zf-HC2 domain-containing protein [Streptomyces corynorhini]RDG35536.1 zf-HC2 domain-containing protein [Streptomyces corynorhini]